MLNEDEDLFEFAFRRMIDLDKTISMHGRSILSAYSRVSKLPNVGIGFGGERPLIVDGAKTFNALRQCASSDCHLLMRVRDPLKLKIFPSSCTFSLKGYRAIVKSWEKKDDSPLKKHLDFLKEVIEKVKPNYCVVNSTIDPVSRLLALASRRAGVRTVCVQHGLYSFSTPAHILEEDIADVYFAIDPKQKDILCRNIPRSKIVSMAIPSEFHWGGSTSASVCFVGTDIERYGMEEKKDRIVSSYKKIAEYLQKEQSCKVFYKPHPSESISHSIKNSFNLISSVDDVNIDFFVGFNSTLLQDMSSAGKPSVQIFDKNIAGTNYEEFGYCKTFLNECGVEKRLAECIQYGGTFPNVVGPDLYSFFRTHKIL